MEDSILISTKKTLGLPDDYVVFDLDIITFINTSFGVLIQLGAVPEEFSIEDSTAVWADLGIIQKQLNLIKTYVFMKTKQYFDPHNTSFHSDAMERQIAELEWRINQQRESTDWVAPQPVTPPLPVFDWWWDL